MNWCQVKDPVSDLCLIGCLAMSWSITQEVAGSNYILQKNISLNSMKCFPKVLEGKKS